MMRAAVLGQPIAHSLSPVLHRAAYEALGLNWSYEAIEVGPGRLQAFLDGLGDEWRGLSLTMPLKLEALRCASFVEPQTKLLGVANTLVPSGVREYRQWVAANTDVHGLVSAFRESGLSAAERAVIIGGGATAVSALAALAQLGATSPVIGLRDRSRAGSVVRAATSMGVTPRLVDLDGPELIAALEDANAVVSTIPADAGEAVASRLPGAVRGTLIDAVYAPLVTPLGSQWQARGGVFVNGTRMLLHQAGEQVRLMTNRVAPVEAMDVALGRVLASR